MSVSETLWEANFEIANKSYSSSFVQGIRSGELPLRNFQEYIAQDSFFLESFARAYGMAIAKSPNLITLKELTIMLSGVVTELELHNKYLKKWGLDISKKTYIRDSTFAYTEFLLKTSKSDDMVKILSAMTPCMRLYYWIGNKIKKELSEKNKLKNNKYIDWIETYSDDSFKKLTDSLENLIDSNFSDDVFNDCNNLYSTAMIYELEFFEDFL